MQISRRGRGGEGQGRAVEEVVEPQTEIDSGELGGDAGQEAVGGRAKWRPKVSVNWMVSRSERPCWRRARLARRPLGGVSTGAPFLVPMGLPRLKAFIGQIGSRLGVPAPACGQRGPVGPTYRTIGARGAEQVLALAGARLGGGAPAQERLGQPAVLRTGRGEHEARHPPGGQHGEEQLTAVVPVFITPAPAQGGDLPQPPPPTAPAAAHHGHGYRIDDLIGRPRRPQLPRHHRHQGHQHPRQVPTPPVIRTLAQQPREIPPPVRPHIT